MRVAVALVVGLAVGMTVTALSNAALYQPFDVAWPPNFSGFWGRVYGSIAAVVSFGLALVLLNRRVPRVARVGRAIAALALGLFGLAVAWWIAMWGFSPWSLEGAWIYPLVGNLPDRCRCRVQTPAEE